MRANTKPLAIQRAVLETLEGRRLLSLTAPVSYTVGAQPNAIIKADFNGDGRADLATANVTGDSVSVLFGNANGTFAAAALSSATGDGPVALASGHFNGDGKLDLVTANAAGFSVLLGNGNGTFAAPTTTAIDGQAVAAVVGDLNGDGKLDLVVGSNVEYPGHYGTVRDPYTGEYPWYPTQWSRQVRVMIGSGAGSFAVPVASTETASSAITSIALADFNRDGKLDRATGYTVGWNGEASLALGNGSGGFGVESFIWLGGASTHALAAADLNADGKTDLVTAHGYDLNVLIGNGTGGFAPRQPYAAGTSPVAVAIADFNGDAKLDLATANGSDNSLSLLLGTGTGIGTPMFTPHMTLRAGTGASGIVAGDFNGDGRADVATADKGANNVGVRLSDLAWPALTAPTLSVNDVSVVEGHTGTVNATFTVSLSAASSQTISVDYFTTATSSATAGVDYADAAGTLSFAPGQTSQTFTVAVKGDRIVEYSEYFGVRLIAPSNAFLGRYWGQATIVDDEPYVSLDEGSSRAEGNTGTAPLTFTVRISEAYDLPITVGYATADISAGNEEGYVPASAGTDYVVATGTVTIPAGQTSATFSVLVNGDRTIEFDESFLVVLQNVPASVRGGGYGQLGTIIDDEPHVTGTSFPGVEGQPQSLKFEIALTYPGELPVTVSYATTDESAIAGVDYQATSGTVTFDPGQTSKMIIVPLKDDHVPEQDESLRLNVIAATNAGVTENYGISGTIRDDEPRIEVDSTPMIEGSSGTKLMAFTARLSTPSDQSVSVQYEALDGGMYGDYAVAGSDYIDVAGILNFAPGQTAKTFTVAIVGDKRREPDEEFSVRLSAPSSNAMLGYNSGALGIILDDDNAQFKKWVGPATGGSWSSAANWSPSGVPGASDRVSISGSAVALAASANVRELYLDNSARLAIAPSTGTRVLRSTALSIAPDSRLDVGNSDVIIDYDPDSYALLGWWNSSWYTGLTGQVATGSNSGAWDGNGIITSRSAALEGLTTVGISEARDALGLTGAQTALFSGQTVDATTVLVKYTYAGDANLDGTLNIDDYTRIDSGVSAGLSGWSNGDFNYDGKMNIDDYVIIDGNIGNQGPPFSNGASIRDADVLSMVGQPTRSWNGSAERDDEWADLLRPAD
jgi:hypothetical protein